MIKLVKQENQYVIYYTYSSPSEARDRLCDKMFELSKGCDLRNYWWRATNNKREHQICGEIRSKNHVDGHMELGLSVSESLAYHYFHGYKYIYVVTGEVVGIGSDGEPLLRNAVALTKPAKTPSKRFQKKDQKLDQLSDELKPLLICGLRAPNITAQYGDYNGEGILLEAY